MTSSENVSVLKQNNNILKTEQIPSEMSSRMFQISLKIKILHQKNDRFHSGRFLRSFSMPDFPNHPNILFFESLSLAINLLSISVSL